MPCAGLRAIPESTSMTSPKLLTDDLMQRFIAHGYLCLGILRLATRYDA